MNVVEYMREKAVSSLFSMPGFNQSFAVWKALIERNLGTNPDFFKVLNLGDNLRGIFKTTGTPAEANRRYLQVVRLGRIGLLVSQSMPHGLKGSCY